MKKRLFSQIDMNKLLVIIWFLALFCGVQVAGASITTYNIFERFYEPDTQPNDSIFIGTFDHDNVTHTVTNLKGILSESMTGGVNGYPNDTMTWLTLNTQLVSWHDAALGGTFAAVFKNINDLTFYNNAPGATDFWSPQVGVAFGGVYYGFPKPANNPGNAYALIFVPDNPLVALTPAQTDKLAYADCAPGGMMGAVCMTGTTVAGYGASGTMNGYPVEQVITVINTVPNPFSFVSQSGVPTNSVINSNAINFIGITTPVSVSISGGFNSEYTVSNDSGATWSAWSTTVPATLANGALVKVRLTSSTSYSSLTTAVLTVGGVSGSFAVTTATPTPVAIPNIVGFSQVAAGSAISGAALTVGNIELGNSDTVPAGSVISQNPASGTTVPPGTAVNMVVSLGPAPESGELSSSILSDAYGLVAADATIRSRVVTFAGIVDFNLNKTISLNGGYSDNTFTTTSGFTTLHGTMIISHGTLRVNNLIIY
jgi:hypothetical protein